MKLITLASVWLRFHLFLPFCPIFIEEKLSLSMMVIEWHSACEEYQKKKKNLNDRNETKRCDWNVRQDERCCKTKRSLGNGQGKKTIACCSFQRAPSAAATRKTVHVSKIKATTTTAKKKQKTKATKAKRRRANKRRGIWTCETSLRLRYNKRKIGWKRIHAIDEQQVTATIAKQQ